MFRNIDRLTSEEVDFLIKTPVYITVMVGGADDEIEDNEINWAEKVARYRSFKSDPDLQKYYLEVDKYFSDQLDQYVTELKKGDKSPREYSKEINEKLQRLNPIFEKLDSSTSEKLYNDFLSFARHVASVSDHIFGMGGINPEEWEYVRLPSVKPPKGEK